MSTLLLPAGVNPGANLEAERAKPARFHLDYAAWRARLAGHASQPNPAPSVPERSSEPRAGASPAESPRTGTRAA